FPIADPSFGISFSTFFAALFSPRPRSSTVRPLLCSALDLSAALDETTVCTSPTANKTTTMTILCMRHLAIGETISRRCAKGGVLSRGERGILPRPLQQHYAGHTPVNFIAALHASAHRRGLWHVAWRSLWPGVVSRRPA